MSALHLLGEARDRPLDDRRLAARYDPGPPGAPWLRVNFVTSVDGAVVVAGQSAGLSGPADKRVFHLLRAGCDALLVGAGTVRREGYGPLDPGPAAAAARQAEGRPAYPTLVVVSRSLDLSPDHPALAAAPIPATVLTCAAAPPAARAALAGVADVVVAGDDDVDLAAGLATLRGRGLHRLLCEGGPQLFGTLTAAGLVDEVCLTVSPLLAGAGAGRITGGPPAPDPARFRLAHTLATPDGMLLLRYVRS